MSGGISGLILSGPLVLAIPVAAAAGAVTFLSPCVLPLVPGYLSYVTGMSGEDAQAGGGQDAGSREGAGQRVAEPARETVPPTPPRSRGGAGLAGEEAAPALAGPADGVAAAARPVTPRRRALIGTLLFVLGFSAVYATEGAAFGGLGVLLRSHSVGLAQVLGGLSIVLGLLFAGIFDRLPVAGRILRPAVRPRAGLAGAPLLGALFGLGWTPCVGPTLTVVLTLAAASGTAVRGAVLTFAYSLGLGIPFLVVALAFQRGMRTFGFARRHAKTITRIGGAMLVAVGVLEVTGAWASVLTWLQTHWVGNYQAPL
jgi:cytochrome c-type biogenesis protein